MTKQEQIEEMAELTFDYVDSKDVSKLYLMGSNADEELRPLLHNYGLSEFIYNAGYRKVPENAVIFTKEEYIDLSRNYVGEQIEQARKETAKEILYAIINNTEESDCILMKHNKWFQQLCKKYGVEGKK